METPLVSTCLVSGRMGLPLPEADRRWTIATPVQAPQMRVRAGSGLFSCPWTQASIRLGLAPRREPARVALTQGGPIGCCHSFWRRKTARREHLGRWVCAATGTGTCGWELWSCSPRFTEFQGYPGARARRRDPRYRSPGSRAWWEIPPRCVGAGGDARLGTGACEWELVSCPPRLTWCQGRPEY